MGDLSKQFISSIPITHMSRLQWIQFKDAIERLRSIEEENGRLRTALSALSSDCLRWVGTSAFPVLCRPRSASHNLALEALAEMEPKP